MIFDGFDALDLAGPFEVFGEAGYELTVAALRRTSWLAVPLRRHVVYGKHPTDRAIGPRW